MIFLYICVIVKMYDVKQPSPFNVLFKFETFKLMQGDVQNKDSV